MTGQGVSRTVQGEQSVLYSLGQDFMVSFQELDILRTSTLPMNKAGETLYSDPFFLAPFREETPPQKKKRKKKKKKKKQPAKEEVYKRTS